MMSNFNWMETIGGSPIMMALIGLSVVTLGIAIERVYYYYKKRSGSPEMALDQAMTKLRSGDRREAARICASCPHPMGAVAVQVLESEFLDGEKAEERLQISLSQQKLLLERNLGMLGTMAAVAPLVGLLGTVWGIMRAFNDMSATGTAAPSVVAAGVAEALVTTAAGLIIAVPALMLYNHLSRRMGVMLTVAENNSRSLRLALVEGMDRSTAGESGAEHRTYEPLRGEKEMEELEPALQR
jgi:biopolymer transport protein ExbB